MSNFSGTTKMGRFHPKPGRRKIIANPPYPIPLKNWDNSESANFYFWKGLLKPNGVEVQDNIEELYSRGFFGKGNFARSFNNIDKFHNSPEKKCEQEKEPKTEQSSSVMDSSKQISVDDNLTTKESLILSHEEAYFLTYAAPCLTIKEHCEELNLNTLWTRLCQLNSIRSFPVIYAAYHYFRSKGWIVKSGLKFGVDYIVYKDGPPFYHASYSILVLNGKCSSPGVSWSQLAALNRTTINAGKEVMFCYVFLPDDINTPECIKNTEIQEVLLTRWISSEERNGPKSAKNS